MNSTRVEIYEIQGVGSREEKEFIELPLHIYRDVPQWVPWFHRDMKDILRRRHPFFEHSGAAFFLAKIGGRPRGRIAVVENRLYNGQHRRRRAHFTFWDQYEETEIAESLFSAAANWAGGRGLDELVGPFGIGGAMGGGLLVKGFEHRAAMTMMSYNFPYYRRLLEELDFVKKLDLLSARLQADRFRLPDRVKRVAEIALARGQFNVETFKTKGEIRRMAASIGRVYNETLGDHPESCPLSPSEIKRATRDLITVADPALIKILTYRNEIAGFLFAFPDLSKALQRGRGRITPFSVVDLLREYRRTHWLIANGAGILPRYQRLGGNALLYYELEKTVKSRGEQFRYVNLTQIAETTGLMLEDMERLGGEIYKIHRIYSLEL